jgi:two-component system chemotaxis sensor kinase CheA
MPSGAKPAPPASPAGGANRATVRVDLDLVDRLINMVGELVINQAVLTQCVQGAGLGKRSPLMASLSDLRNLTREIQESVMAIRAQPVKPLFQRMARIVREASEMAGKTAHFVTEGDATEVDKTAIEQLVDPLTHMIRNAIDHGLEPVELRRAAGKADAGTVKLTAAHRSGRVVIEVADDGAGINRPKVLEIARRKGLVAPEAVLTDPEIDNLLFLPGFSTATAVTDLSGRGVGMDVVLSSIRRLGGRVAVSSIPGRGTTMSVSLPLTLAVLDGMVVDVAGQTMVVPITAIVETIRPEPGSVHPLGPEGVVVGVRDRFVPVIDLGVLFGHRSEARAISDMVLLLVETDARETCALAVDKIYDQRQIVIKGLETNYGHVPCVAAATILGDGKIALIIDPEETAAMGRSAGAGPAACEE